MPRALCSHPRRGAPGGGETHRSVLGGPSDKGPWQRGLPTGRTRLPHSLIHVTLAVPPPSVLRELGHAALRSCPAAWAPHGKRPPPSRAPRGALHASRATPVQRPSLQTRWHARKPPQEACKTCEYCTVHVQNEFRNGGFCANLATAIALAFIYLKRRKNQSCRDVWRCRQTRG